MTKMLLCALLKALQEVWELRLNNYGLWEEIQTVAKKVDVNMDYELDNAISFLQENPTAKFDETIEFAFRMELIHQNQIKQFDQTVALPHGTGKDVRVIVFALGDAAEKAKDAGAYEVGFEDLIKKSFWWMD